MLITNGTWSFAMFNYLDDGMGWSSFRRNHITYYAVAGYDDIIRERTLNIEHSGTSRISNIVSMSNVNISGRFIFQIDEVGLCECIYVLIIIDLFTSCVMIAKYIYIYTW